MGEDCESVARLGYHIIEFSFPGLVVRHVASLLLAHGNAAF
jgi:hypothetical protein